MTMKKLITLIFITTLALPVWSQRDVSFQNEIQRSIDRGLAWMKSSQNAEGWWTSPDHPAVTAMALLSYHGNPNLPKKTPAWVKKGHEFLLTKIQPNGSIYTPGKGLANYNTSLCMMAMLASRDVKYNPTVIKARGFLVKQQFDEGVKGKTDHPLDGGVGYGTRYSHSDLNNTLIALEALYYSRHLVKDAPDVGKDLNWKAAIDFIQNCQNLKSHNKQPWVSDDPENKGGFIYFPGKSMAENVKGSGSGRTALRSYGSISYAGMLSYAYAQMKQTDPRVKAVRTWIAKNYTLEENPAMGQQGLFYYYFLMTKALTVYGSDMLELPNGKKVDWRKDLGLKLMSLQEQDGSWLNTKSARWWEGEKPLVTAYSIISLNYIHRGQ
jgi:squalene-hopene/tetraprenyl-beta-curcumene cyclase